MPLFEKEVVTLAGGKGFIAAAPHQVSSSVDELLEGHIGGLLDLAVSCRVSTPSKPITTTAISIRQILLSRESFIEIEFYGYVNIFTDTLHKHINVVGNITKTFRHTATH